MRMDDACHVVARGMHCAMDDVAGLVHVVGQIGARDDSALKVDSIPTIVVLDRTGKVAYRTQGFVPDNFADALSGAITKASGGQAQ